MKSWVEFSGRVNRRAKLFEVGQLAVTYRLRPMKGPANPGTSDHNVQLEPEKADDQEADEDQSWDAPTPGPSPARPA